MMRRNRISIAFSLFLVLFAALGWRNQMGTMARTVLAAVLPQSEPAPLFGPVLFLIKADPLALPVNMPPTVVFHTQVSNGESPQFVASGSAEAVAQLQVSGVEVTVLDENTVGDVYYFVDAQAESARELALLVGRIILEQESALLLAVPLENEPTLLQTLPTNGAWIASLTADAMVLATEPEVQAAQAQFVYEPANSSVTELINQLNTNELYNYTAQQAGNAPVTVNGQRVYIASRYSFSGYMRYAEQYLFDFFNNLGYNTSFAPWSYAGYSGRNVIAEKRGSVTPSRIWLIGGHFDTISQNPYYDSPGADDNGTGVAATMAIARILRDYSFADTIRFVAFSGEEEGQWGSKVYARNARLRGENIVGYINLDMIGWDSNTDRVMEIHTGYGPKSNALGTQFIAANDRYGQGLVIERKSNSASRFSDHSPFWDNNYGAFLVIENYFYDAPRAADKHPWNHTTGDILSRIPFDYVLRISRTAMAMLVESAGLQGQQATPTPTATGALVTPTATHTSTPTWTPTPPPSSCSNLLVNGDIEGSGGWTFGTTPYAGGIVNSPVHAGGRALRLGIPPGVANRLAHSSAFQRLTIPANAAQVVLRYWERTGGGSDGRDYREVLLLASNYSVLRVVERSTAVGNDTWTQRAFDLTAYRGQTIFVYFNTFNNGTGMQQWNYLDDAALLICTSASNRIDTEPMAPEEVPGDVPGGTIPGGTIPNPAQESVVYLPVIEK